MNVSIIIMFTAMLMIQLSCMLYVLVGKDIFTIDPGSSYNLFMPIATHFTHINILINILLPLPLFPSMPAIIRKIVMRHAS